MRFLKSRGSEFDFLLGGGREKLRLEQRTSEVEQRADFYRWPVTILHRPDLTLGLSIENN